ncbi:hypothetical protein [Streptosporangium sp. CA-115845]|uniref:hypothetical protein n=1 Tax=Streptosporangium sp. CA-115845 TaxID=3240071 RepID=UPI003D92A716
MEIRRAVLIDTARLAGFCEIASGSCQRLPWTCTRCLFSVEAQATRWEVSMVYDDDTGQSDAHIIGINDWAQADENRAVSTANRKLIVDLFKKDPTLGALGIRDRLKARGHNVPLEDIKSVLAKIRSANQKQG